MHSAIEVFVPDIGPTYSRHQSGRTLSVQRSTNRTLCLRSNRSRFKTIFRRRASFRSILDEYDEVFDPYYACYNGHVGPFEAVVNMGAVQPPQRKGNLPQYARNHLVELQAKFDELETIGLFVRPDDVPVNLEYLNPSFLIKKRIGGHRLVTAFSDVGRYSKPQPSLMPDVDGTLRKIAQWQNIATTDLSNAFYQIPLSWRACVCPLSNEHARNRDRTRGTSLPCTRILTRGRCCRKTGRRHLLWRQHNC